MGRTRFAFLISAGLLVSSCTEDASRLDATAASDLLVRDILPEAVPPSAPFRAVRVADIVPAGSTIVPSAPGGTGTGPGQDPLPEITITERTHLFLIDLHPQTFFSHPVKYALVGESGRAQVVEASWLPAVNGVVPPELADDEPDPDLLVAGNWANHLGIGTVSSWRLAPWLDQAPSEGYIVVQGLMPEESLYADSRATGLEGKAFFDAYASSNGRVDLLEEGDADTVLAVMGDMASEGRSPIVVSILAHGSIDSVRLGGQLVTAQDFVQRVRMHPDHTFSFLIGSCHSGSFVDDLRLEPNVRVVATAVGPNEGAVPDWDTSPLFNDENPADTGSEWFSSYYRAAADILGDAQRMAIVHELASLFGVGQTEMLLCQTVYGAIGYNPLLLPERLDFDFSHALGVEAPVTYGTRTPIRYCSWF